MFRSFLSFCVATTLFFTTPVHANTIGMSKEFYVTGCGTTLDCDIAVFILNWTFSINKDKTVTIYIDLYNKSSSDLYLNFSNFSFYDYLSHSQFTSSQKIIESSTFVLLKDGKESFRFLIDKKHIKPIIMNFNVVVTTKNKN